MTDPDIQRAVDTFQLGLPRLPASGLSGELLGSGTGSSLEFQEYRQYIPGDDIRHLYWGAYARSDTLMVRLYREEISPRTEVLLDASRSMTSGGETKPRVAKQLAALFAFLSARLGGRPTVIPLNDSAPQPMSLDGLELISRLPFDGRTTLPDLLATNSIPLKRRAVRIVISDFLFPHDPASLVRRLAGDASGLWIVQLLNKWEAEPTVLGGRRMIDIETGGESEILLDRSAIAAYQQRLTMLQEELLRNCRRVHASFAILVAEKGLAELCRDELCAAGMLRVA